MAVNPTAHQATQPAPSAAVPIADANGMVNSTWLQFFVSVYQTLTLTNLFIQNTRCKPIVPVTLGPSPFHYSPPSNGTVFVSAGSGVKLQIQRDATVIDTGLTSGAIPMTGSTVSGKSTDTLIITYIAPPTVNFSPKL